MVFIYWCNKVESFSEFCETRTKFVKSRIEKVQKITKTLETLKHYFEPFDETGRILYNDYVDLRKSKIPFKIQSEAKNQQSIQIEELESTFVNVEKSILEEILSEK